MRTAAEGTSADMDTKLDCSSIFHWSSCDDVGELVVTPLVEGDSVGT